MIEVGVVYVGKGGYDVFKLYKVSSIVVDFIMLEIEYLIWYFWGMVCDFKLED